LKAQQLIVTYEDDNREISILKVTLKQSLTEDACLPVEFEVDFAGLTEHNMDATVNWQSIDVINWDN
jgi:hypothetical protein